MIWEQRLLHLPSYPPGFHLITELVEQVLFGMPEIRTGMLFLLLQHTSASLTLNENADPLVRKDLKRFLNDLVDEIAPRFEHTDEGPDDMPAHVKSSLLGTTLSIPVAGNKLLLGTWQGIYLGEHRESSPGRRLVVTVTGI